MTPYSNIAYARLALDYDRNLFCEEYDRYILPNSEFIANGKRSWLLTRKLNQAWNMVDPVTYDQTDNETKFGLDPRKTPQWQMNQLMYLVTNDNDEESVKSNAGKGGTYMRNMYLDREWKIKPEFEHLEIVKFILKLPFSKLSSIHCVSLEPGRCATIHRDTKRSQNHAVNNSVLARGYVVLTLNLSDGGVPLYWALDGSDVHNAIKTNDPAYIISDYFLHGVPVCTSRRRQVRITGIPTDELQNLIDHGSKIVLPDDYAFDEEKNWFPG